MWRKHSWQALNTDGNYTTTRRPRQPGEDTYQVLDLLLFQLHEGVEHTVVELTVKCELKHLDIALEECVVHKAFSTLHQVPRYTTQRLAQRSR